MGMRFVNTVLKGISPEHLSTLIAEASKVLPGPKSLRSKWGDLTEVCRMRQLMVHAESGMVVLTPDAWRIGSEIARLARVPHLELRVQEGDHWDFTLYFNNEIIADFSTHVAYWNDDPAAPRPWKKGTARDFANVWRVPLEYVEPYLIDWGALPERRWVVSGDKASTGNWQQVFDFMRAAGIPQFTKEISPLQFSVPSWEMIEIRQPLWRRVVRRVSVWVRGAYPDVPGRTAAEIKVWRRRRANIRVVPGDINNP